MPDLGPSTIGIVAAFAISAIGTWRTRAYALRKKMLDQPNARGSHTVATPRGGGVGIVTGLAAGCVVLGLVTSTAAHDVRRYWGVAVGGLIVAGVGWWDDHGHVSARTRAAIQAVAATLAVAAAGGMGAIAVGSKAVHVGILGSIIAVIGMVWLTNLYNFMDGIDGIAGSQAVTAATGLGCLLLWDGRTDHAAVAMLIGAATLGFLLFNWPPARIFMGDVGSGFLGCIFGGQLVVLSRVDGKWVWVALILLAPFVADATTTLVRRLIGGQKWYEAHRSHAYQNLSRRWSSHRRVTLSLIAIVCAWCFPLAALAARRSELALVALCCCYVPLIGAALALGAGVPGRYESRSAVST